MFARVRLKNLGRIGLVLGAVLLLLACQDHNAAVENNYPNGRLLVETDWLAERVDDLDSVRIIDMREPAAYAKVHVYFLRLMGYENVRGYDGSWSDWGNDPDLTVVMGTEPG